MAPWPPDRAEGGSAGRETTSGGLGKDHVGSGRRAQERLDGRQFDGLSAVGRQNVVGSAAPHLQRQAASPLGEVHGTGSGRSGDDPLEAGPLQQRRLGQRKVVVEHKPGWDEDDPPPGQPVQSPDRQGGQRPNVTALPDMVARGGRGLRRARVLVRADDDRLVLALLVVGLVIFSCSDEDEYLKYDFF